MIERLPIWRTCYRSRKFNVRVNTQRGGDRLRETTGVPGSRISRLLGIDFGPTRFRSEG
jgi:hypothetical protein